MSETDSNSSSANVTAAAQSVTDEVRCDAALQSDIDSIEALSGERLSSDAVNKLYEQHAAGLRNFLIGILRNSAATADALQVTFTKLIEKGHLVKNRSSMKAWLFRVAFNEALIVKRKVSVKQRHAEPLAWKIHQSASAEKGNDKRLSEAVHQAIQKENVDRVRTALKELPETLQDVVRLRIYEGLKFKDIAVQLDAPLGTVLARMQSALKKLKPVLTEKEKEGDN